MKKTHIGLLVVAATFCTGSAFFSWKLSKTVSSLSKKSNAVYEAVFPEIVEKIKEEEIAKNWDHSLCRSLSGIPYGEDAGFIKSVKRISVDGVLAPHNASILEDQDGYLLFFRHDIKDRVRFMGMTTPLRQKVPFISKTMPYRTFIGAVRLDKNFQQISSVQRIDTKSDFSEDPRVFRMGNDVYMSYNDMQENPLYSRTMHLASIDPETLKTRFIVDIDQHIHHVDQANHVEKNWVPFVCREDGEDKVYFEYGINPHKIMAMKKPSENLMDHLVYPHEVSLQKMPWKAKWGPIRGGTPARLVDGQYLAFFHTLFYEGKKPWYVMGAYTFESKPPYRVTSISSAPILFKGIYDTPTKNTAHSNKKAIYPSGLALGNEDGRDVLYVSCGENDCTVKIITFDKEALLKHLTPIPLYEKPKN
jgi:hypothetical protein